MDDYSTGRLAAREAIRDVLHRYCRAVDRGLSDTWHLVFHADAEMRCGPYEGDIAGFARMLDERRAQVRVAVHMIGNTLFDFTDDSHAFVESYCLALEEFLPVRPGEAGLNRLARVRYADRFEVRDEQWRIARRIIVIDHAWAPTPVGTEAFFKGPSGRRDVDDIVLTERAALGF